MGGESPAFLVAQSERGLRVMDTRPFGLRACSGGDYCVISQQKGKVGATLLAKAIEGQNRKVFFYLAWKPYGENEKLLDSIPY